MLEAPVALVTKNIFTTNQTNQHERENICGADTKHCYYSQLCVGEPMHYQMNSTVRVVRVG